MSDLRSRTIRLAAVLPKNSSAKTALLEILAGDISIGALARGVQNWAKALERHGFSTEVDVFRGGRTYGSSVELEIEKPYTDEFGDEDTYYWSVTFVSGGYGSVGETKIGGSEGWRAMKAEALQRLKKDLRVYKIQI